MSTPSRLFIPECTVVFTDEGPAYLITHWSGRKALAHTERQAHLAGLALRLGRVISAEPVPDDAPPLRPIGPPQDRPGAPAAPPV
ncbi:hypothetical protein [Nonomuraea sp. 10N515B]|uniref:hypothetical protein n=1 Tax=Nonomuraea sp. 10N515B TaxID=3457422 RepID=UPI003FCC43D4